MSKLKTRFLRSASLLAIFALIAGCASNVPELIRTSPSTNIGISEVRSDSGRYIDLRVRWGGSIVAVENLAHHTLIEILERPLSGSGKPDDSAKSSGRFMARVAGFLDPEEYPKGRLFSVTGRLSKNIEKPIGEYLYDYPVVGAEAYYLWPETAPYPYSYPYYWDPFYYYPWHPYRYPYPLYW